MPKKSKKVSRVTPFRISVTLNAVLGFVVLAVIGTGIIAYHDYSSGSDRAVRFDLTYFNSYYCDIANQKFDQWMAKQQASDGGFTKEDAKKARLQYESICVTNRFEPYYMKALRQFYNDNGIDYDKL